MGGSEGITIVGHHYFALAEGLEIDCSLEGINA
jgi:hypothetical protein